MRFINRQSELATLDRFYAYHRAAMMFISGQLRIGKTTLLSHWLRRRDVADALFWTVPSLDAASQLRDFSQVLARFDPRVQAPPSGDFSFPDWRSALMRMGEIVALSRRPVLVIIDEFTRLMMTSQGVDSAFQIAWDHRLSELPNMRLILTGSHVGIMERDVLSGRAPLFGRAVYYIRLRPLSFGTLKKMLPDRSPADRVAIYAITGGIPAYLDFFARSATFNEGLRKCLSPDSIMLADTSLRLRDEVEDPRALEAILSAIAGGAHEWDEIASSARIRRGLGKCLMRLEDMGIVERRDSVLSPIHRKGRYYICNPFLRFYYRCIVPHLDDIERGKLNRAVRDIAGDLATVSADVFEELCREWIFIECGHGRLDLMPETVGTFWAQQRGQATRLDLVATSRKEQGLFIATARWNAARVGRNTLSDLVARSQVMPQVKDPGWRVQYGLFARDGFTESAVKAARETGARLVSLCEVEDRLVEAVARHPTDLSNKNNLEF